VPTLSRLKSQLEEDARYAPIFGDNPGVIARKKALLRNVYATFCERFGREAREGMGARGATPDRGLRESHGLSGAARRCC